MLHSLIGAVRNWAKTAIFTSGVSGSGKKKASRAVPGVDGFIADLLFVACGVRSAALLDLPVSPISVSALLHSLSQSVDAVFGTLRAIGVIAASRVAQGNAKQSAPTTSECYAVLVAHPSRCVAALDADVANNFASKVLVNVHPELGVKGGTGPLTLTAESAVLSAARATVTGQLALVYQVLRPRLCGAVSGGSPALIGWPLVTPAAASLSLTSVVGWFCSYAVIYCFVPPNSNPAAAASAAGAADAKAVAASTASATNCLSNVPLRVYTLSVPLRSAELKNTPLAESFTHSYFTGKSAAALKVCSFSVPSALDTPKHSISASKTAGRLCAELSQRLDALCCNCNLPINPLSRGAVGGAAPRCRRQLFGEPTVSATEVTLTSVAM